MEVNALGITSHQGYVALMCLVTADVSPEYSVKMAAATILYHEHTVSPFLYSRGWKQITKSTPCSGREELGSTSWTEG